MAANVTKQQQSRTTTADGEREVDSEVAQFYQGQVIFITGGTGFIGKVLLEKLLRSCPGLKRVYLLIRSKRGESPQARLEKMVQSEMFVHLRQEQPDAFEKVTVLAGDLKEPNLGLSASDEATLVDSVSVVFHSGATVRFDEPLREAVQLNVLGTRRVLDLCKKMRNLCALVHVSTAYCNFDKKDVHEMVYPSPVSAEKLIESARSQEEDGADSTKGCLYGHPNTYTLTKNVAETLLQEERGDIPVAIVRPSIVTASVKEPLPGWIDNYNACTGIIVALGAGLLQSLFVDKRCVGDVVPVDYVANMIICVAWKTAQTRPKDIGVYHCTSGALKHATWGQLIDEMLRAARRYPLPNVIRFPEFHLTDSRLWHDINLWCLHYVPARIVDTALQLYGQKPRFVRYYQKARKATDPVRKFMTREWLFRPTNALRLQEELSPRDAQLFDFNVQHIEWSSYVDAYVLGIRKYLLKAEDSQLPEARKHLKRLNALRWSWYLVLTAIPCGLAANTAAWNMFSVPSFATGLRDVIGFQRLL